MSDLSKDIELLKANMAKAAEGKPVTIKASYKETLMEAYGRMGNAIERAKERLNIKFSDMQIPLAYTGTIFTDDDDDLEDDNARDY